MMDTAKSSLSWIPVLTTFEVGGLILACVFMWLLLRFVQGKSLVGGRVELLMLRGISLAALAAILFGPTIVDEEPGKVFRPAMMMVFDGSQSMQLGQESSRWESALQFARTAETAVANQDSQNCRRFQFGHQLQPLDRQFHKEDDAEAGSNPLDSNTVASPNATDSRLADALRQLLPVATSESTSGVILFSDGRVRATDTVEKLADVFKKASIPIHVVPIGESSGAGDIAVVSMVVPSSVRKFTENEIQVFLRSFGYDGQRTSVQVRRKGSSEEDRKLLAELPVTLRGGAQSVSLTFRVDAEPESLVVSVTPLKDELTTRNNTVTTEVGINRTKVRVLYVEGDLDSNSRVTRSTTSESGFGFGMLDAITGGSQSRTTSNLDVRTALQMDADVECTMLLSSNGRAPIAMDAQSTNTRTFPITRAELFAYDCVVLSNVGPDVLSEQQAQWLTQWVEGRGGGLVVTGSSALQNTAWVDSPLEALLPLQLGDSQVSLAGAIPVTVSEPNHPVWRLMLEQQANSMLLEQLPGLHIGIQGHTAKPTADVLAIESTSDRPVMMGHRAGRGRVLVSTADLTAGSLSTLAETWGQQPERSASKLWRNIVYWVTEGSSTGRRRLIASSDKRFYRPGENLEVTATAYDEAARQETSYRIWAMFEPLSLDDMSVYSPILWPENMVRESGEVGPRIAWGEELKLKSNSQNDRYHLPLQLSETGMSGDTGFRIEMTAYEGEEAESAYSHGTQVDSTSLTVQILSDPFEQQNPLPNHELMTRIASLSGGSVLQSPEQLAELLQGRPKIQSASMKHLTPAWDQWWLWLCLAASLTAEWCRRRLTGLA